MVDRVEEALRSFLCLPYVPYFSGIEIVGSPVARS